MSPCAIGGKRLAPLLFSSLLLAACKDVTRFSTEPGESYCGGIVQEPWWRDGFSQYVGLRMTFDAIHMEDPTTPPGAVSTFDSKTSERLLNEAPLHVIGKLNNDPLSTLQFGEGRDRNAVYMVDPSDPNDGPSILAVVSFLHNGNAEVRLIRGASLPDGGPPQAVDGKVLLGIFPLARKPTADCGF